MKLSNAYVQELDPSVYDAVPKAVLAAVAISALTGGGDHLDHATQRIVTEWHTLHQAGVVPQPVPVALRPHVLTTETLCALLDSW